MGPPSYKKFTLMLPVQIHLSHFSLGSLIYLVVILMCLSGLTVRDVGVHMAHFYSQLLQTGSNISAASALPVVLLSLLQPPPQGIGHHPGVGVKIEHWPLLSTGDV